MGLPLRVEHATRSGIEQLLKPSDKVPPMRRVQATAALGPLFAPRHDEGGQNALMTSPAVNRTVPLD
jgi:hypothetical protein